MRTPSIPWEVYREQLIQLKYVEKKSLSEINKILFEKLGKSVTNARLSQVFTAWRDEEEAIKINQGAGI